MERKTLITLVVVAVISLVVGGLVGYYALPRKEGYSRYMLDPTGPFDPSILAEKSNGFINQPKVGEARRGDITNTFNYSNIESNSRKTSSSGTEAYAAPSYGLVRWE